MRFKLIACEILFRELAFLASRSPHRIDVEFLPKGLHDLGRKGMFNRLNDILSAQDETSYDAILLGYALCSGGVVGLQSRAVPIVIPRAHDCITLFLGDRKRYSDYFETNPGTYFKTTGWIERGGDLMLFPPDSIQDKTGMGMSLAQLEKKYGAENARYLWEQLSSMVHYEKLTFIETGLEPNERFEQETRDLAEKRGWTFEKLQGNLLLLEQLLHGNWNEDDFLIVPPGETIQFDYSDRIMKCIK